MSGGKFARKRQRKPPPLRFLALLLLNAVLVALAIVFAVMYGVISWQFAYYGEMITYMCMTMPMAAFEVNDLYGFGNWKRMQKRQAV